MPSITAGGLGSGLDINGLVGQLMTLERRPLAQLDAKEAGLQARLTAYGSLKSALSNFQSTTQGLSSPDRFQSVKATAADDTLFQASATMNAEPGTYAVEVKQLAQAQKLASKAFANTTDPIGTGTITIQFGSYNGGVFTANSAKSTKTLSIDAAHASLTGIRDAINGAKLGVSASILNDGTGNRLVLTSAETGATNGLKITVSRDAAGSDVDDTGLSQLAYDPAATAGNGKNLIETVAAQNALLKVDGLDNISKASNTVTDVIEGVTLTLRKQSPVNTPAALTVARDTATVKQAIEDFVQGYNDLQKTVKDLTAYNPDTKQGAVLQGDSAAVSILSQVRRALSSGITGLSGAYDSLGDIGVSFQKDGTLKLDSAKLQSALDSNFADIAGLFATQGKATDSLVKFLSATDRSQAGTHAVAVTQLAAQGYFNGASSTALADTATTFTAPFVVDANNDTFSIKVDGVQSGTITLAQGSYTTAAALTAEIQSKLNGDSTLKAAGVTAGVSFDAAADRLVITSDRYGSASQVEITAVDAGTTSSLGLTIGAGVTGVDVAGTINGAVATGSGRFLTAASGAAVGIKVEIAGGSVGDRGAIGYSRGFAHRLSQLASELLGESGGVASRTEGINRTIADINDRRQTLSQRLDSVERRLRAQFNAMDSLVASLRSTSDYLTRQLASLTPSSNSQARR